ncbi:MAG: M23 family metallopeptidase [Thermanaeromonas sp.]|uniref:peptidoglycan DD-metalloendopeptidase family protein n=1 Tax=Thermanaeromonas sp. TaxID=2003697 RepID=UPI00243B8F02|nr:M23 family metallopeptidase [Thermanaeromonas sp.]MCG0277036.1 M23 family metallopeptidase [Thermanaeromonas sp.]
MLMRRAAGWALSLVLAGLWALSGFGPGTWGTRSRAEAAIVEDLQEVAAVVAPAQYEELASRVNPLTRLYQVEEGDTIKGIARRYRLDAELLAAMNDLDLEASLTTGQFLVLPFEGERTYEVKKGDTIWGIAQVFDLRVEEIMEANGITDPRTLQVGTLLTLPESRKPVGNYSHPVSRGGLVSFLWPVIGPITSFFGWRGEEFHHGLDIAVEAGTLIRSARSGTVEFSGWRNSIYGRTVILDHGQGLKTVYAHNEANLVVPGEYVEAGQVIARVGSSGRATGPHLHFEVWEKGRPVNPLRFLP